MYSGPSGFYKTPVSKVFLGLVAASSLLCISTPAFRHHFTLTYEAVFRQWQLWRLVTSCLAFQSLPELIFGLYILYFFRLFERLLGSTKYIVLVLFASLASSLMQALVLLVLAPHLATDALMDDAPPSSGIAGLVHPHPVPGPYGLIFASFVLYALDVPATARFTLFTRLQFSDKSLVYAAGFQLLLSSWSHSLLPGACGVLAGLLFRFNFCGVRRAQCPAPLAALASQHLAFLASAPPDPTPATRAPSPGTRGGGEVAPTQRPQHVGAGPGGVAGRAPGPGFLPAGMGGGGGPPSQENVEQLMAMGFDRDSALAALMQSRDDLLVATNILLESQTLGGH